MVFPSYNVQNGGGRMDKGTTLKTVALAACAAVVLIMAIYVVATFGGELSELTEIDG